ncbi:MULTISPECIES: hypothetical protein [Bacillus cereus group]|uniref:Group-specific protein n=1 Tax=Bacillus cereus TaxID=1396 RepID=A0A2C0EM38_BACCE|nr:hypothetical protein [Bacillus cereus]PDY83381.1 hypothetical protein CON06_06865 [Bacillus cereus]PFA16495.1 hypothetical protein CN382_05515 [Bacillus cereus]PFM42508.1 hypothetical protein COJ43_00740 [Bacillus cereus]PGL59548.1 hypothetical protein CN927_17795 [Bacillus cereus]PGQ07444.1 hypothetical protein COA08_18340 [Bacillus cereus]
MQPKIHTWKSYMFLTFSLFSTILMVSLVPVLDRFGPNTITPMTYAILCGTILSIIMAIISFISPSEKKVLPIIALVVTLLNILLISSVLLFGYLFTK